MNRLKLRGNVLAAVSFTLISASFLSGCASRGPVNAIPTNTDGALPASTMAVTNVNDSGAGSLRAAIQAVNARQAAHAVITFAASGTIRLASDLPQISTNVTIDGSSAPQYAGRPLV